MNVDILLKSGNYFSVDIKDFEALVLYQDEQFARG